jgi:2-polyprenyl-3-methyl-5-hydroxy-6-metoxy-1,4-benzoquinol methylase
VQSLAAAADTTECVETESEPTFLDRVFGAPAYAERTAAARPEWRVETYRTRNKRHYDRHLRDVLPQSVVERVGDVEAFLDDATRTDTSWAALYCGGFAARLQGARVLEVGAGDGANTLVMAALGADVTCVDISDQAPPLVRAAAGTLGLAAKVEAISGDFTEVPLDARRPFDFVVGKAFLHHLTHEQEAWCLQRAAAILRPGGEARFAEPAVNSGVLDACRWLIAVPGRPSSLDRDAFRGYLDTDPHPARDNSSAHYRRQGRRFFEQVEIVPIGGLERFERLLPRGRFHRPFRRAALRVERWLPYGVQLKIARAQTIVLSTPRRAAADPGAARRSS